MGKSTERYRSYLGQQAAQSQAASALRSRQANERTLLQQEMLLGTDRQLSGNLTDITEEERPYLGRFQLDEAMASSFETHEKAAGIKSILQQNVREANQLMEQAQQAARGGDLQRAKELQAQAEGRLTSDRGRQAGFYPILDVSKVRGAFSTIESPEEEALLRLESPQAQTLGQMVKEARDFQDMDSETSREFLRKQTEGAQRSIAASARGAQRQARDIGLSRGAARNPYAAAQVGSSIERDFAGQRAQVETQAAQFFETYRREYATNTLGFAQQWLQGQAGIREGFQAAVDKIKLSQAQISMQSAQLSAQLSGEAAKRAAESKARTMSYINMGVGLIATVLTLGAGSVGGALLGAGGAAASSAAT